MGSSTRPAAEYARYRESDREQARTADLLRLLPEGRRTILDIGAREGHFSRLLAQRFESVTALDLIQPDFEFPGVTTVAGDVTALNYRDNSFDVVFCAEVLEHICDLRTACAEIVRVARHEIVIGVPYKQDTRLGRTTCRSCGYVNPPWGHINTFDERKLEQLFDGTNLVAKSLVGTSSRRTTAVSAFLMNLAGNPWGTYDVEEGCIRCGATLVRPEHRSFGSRMCSTAAYYLNQLQDKFSGTFPNWIHILLKKA